MITRTDMIKKWTQFYLCIIVTRPVEQRLDKLIDVGHQGLKLERYSFVYFAKKNNKSSKD